MFDDDDDDFADVGTAAQIPNGGIRVVAVGGRDIMLTRFGDDIAAMGANCTHAFASLRDGEIVGTTITCHRHGARFDLKTGRSLSGMCPSLPRFEVRRLGARVLVKRERD